MSKKDNEYKPRKTGRLIAKIFLGIFIAIIIVVVTAFISGYFFLKNKLGKMEYINLTSADIQINDNVENNLSDYRNIALLGIDARKDTFGTGNRSDCIMILSLNQKTNDVKITSVYRDTYLDIEGYGLDKVTHAYSYGGPQLALNTLNKNLDLNITEFVAINFDTVYTAVNCVGGVEIKLDTQEVKYINSYINALNNQFGTSSSNITEPGTYNLDGVQALAYSRIRYTDGGDYKRTERMRDVLMAVFDKAKTMKISSLNRLLDVILPHVSTNISEDEIISMIPKIASFNVVSNFGWPYNTKGITKDRWYGVPVDLENNVSQLHKDLFGKNDYEPTSTVKEISDHIIKDTGYTR